MKRKLELWVGWVSAGLVTVILGPLSLIMNQLTHAQYQEIFLPVFDKKLAGIPVEKGIEFFHRLGAWFGVTLILVLIFTALASLFLNSRYDRRIASAFYFMAGLTTLFGSQFLAFILAFPFFVAGVLSFKKR
ncbi:MAG: DUF4064 domain-containing protein [Enterococcus sp.]|jgi:uncharacterized membrane protein SirB2|nr:DUF4064 domain-containing protein [Enterococcus sp.]